MDTRLFAWENNTGYPITAKIINEDFSVFSFERVCNIPSWCTEDGVLIKLDDAFMFVCLFADVSGLHVRQLSKCDIGNVFRLCYIYFYGTS